LEVVQTWSLDLEQIRPGRDVGLCRLWALQVLLLNSVLLVKAVSSMDNAEQPHRVLCNYTVSHVGSTVCEIGLSAV